MDDKVGRTDSPGETGMKEEQGLPGPPGEIGQFGPPVIIASLQSMSPSTFYAYFMPIVLKMFA